MYQKTPPPPPWSCPGARGILTYPFPLARSSLPGQGWVTGVVILTDPLFWPPLYREKGTHTKKGGGSLQHYLHPLNLRGRGPYQFPTLLNT